MPHTHTIEIKINGIDVEGEVTFSGKYPFHLQPSSIDTNAEKFKSFSAFVKSLAEFSEICGDIKRIEILKKEVL